MFKTKRKRAVVLALIAFFCTAAVTYVAVDWKRFGGGFLAFFKGDHGNPVVASHGGSSDSKAGRMAAGDSSHSNGPALPRLAAATSRKHASGLTGGANGGKSDDDLFKYGDPAAGGIPPGSFIVAQNDTPTGGNTGGAGSPAPSGAPAAPEATGSPAAGGGEGGGGGVSSPAPAPTGTNGGSTDSGLPGTKTPTPAPPPAATPPAATPPAQTPPASPPVDAPAPAPTQSGTTDDPGTPPPPPSGPTDTPAPPSTSLPPVSAIPEASNLAMMSLGALFLAVAASRKRKQQG